MRNTILLIVKKIISQMISWTAFFIYLILISILLLMIGEFISSYKLGINNSQSEIPGIYALKPLHEKIKKHDLVAFDSPNIPWIKKNNYLLRNSEFIKHVGAIPGEYLFTRFKTVYSCPTKKFNSSCHALGTCLTHDSQGNKIPCQQWNVDRIPENQYYMQSIRDLRSLDSRYLGLIPLSLMRYHAYLLVSFNFLSGHTK